jgi:protein SCO1/2
MSPEGQFVDAFGRSFGKDVVIEKVDEYIQQYKSGKKWKNEE